LFPGSCLYCISLLFNAWETITRMAVKTVLIILYPYVLYLFRFYEPMELKMIQSGWDKWKDPKELKENFTRFFTK